MNDSPKHIEPVKIHKLPGRGSIDSAADLTLRLHEVQAQRVATIVLEQLEPFFDNLRNLPAQFEECQVHWDKFYTADFLAERWYPDKPVKAGKNAVYRIPDAELPRHRIGQGKGRVLFYGKEIKAYEQTLTK